MLARSGRDPGICPACGADTTPGSRFCASCGTLLPAAPDRATTPGGLVGPQHYEEALDPDEMRPVTSLFADIVGSTSLGERLPPDEVKALIGECVNRMSRAVEAFGGMVQAYMGDGICAYFGVPVAHPDDPERAARAARRILRLVGDYGRDIADAWGLPDFKVRIGINSGLAAVGKVGANDPQHVALGDATNVAARLQAHAAPGTVVVGEETARQLSHRFGLEPLGRVGVKGRSEDVSAFMLLGPRRKPPHSPAAPLIGRARERARLEAVMAGLAAGRGQVLLVVGEPGLGKSRLLEELRAVAPQGTVWLAGHCASYGGELPYWPFVEMLRAWLEVEEGDAEIAVRTKLRAKLGRLMGEAAGRVLPQLAWLLGITMDPQVHAGLGDGSSGDVGQEIVEAYAGWIESLTSSSPVVVALDDLHWADASTRELADRLLEVTDGAPLAVASALEPESGSEGWGWRLRVLGDYSHRVTEVILEPLPHDAAEQLVDAVTPAGRLDPDVKSQILDRAEGNPFYIEQLIRTLLDAGGVQRRRTWSIAPRAGLPTTVEALLVARMDRLAPEARRLAQAAAVVGRRFSLRVLLGALEERDVTASVAVLLRAGIIRELRRYPEIEYSFRHGLLQQAALSTLTPSRQRALSGRVGEFLEKQFGRSGEEDPEILAYYFYRSHSPDKALTYLERAAARAEGMNATARAIELLERATRVASKSGDGGAGRRLREHLGRLREQANGASSGAS